MPSFQSLILFFLALLVFEILLLIEVGGVLGTGWTLLLVVGTAVVGTALMRLQGFTILARAHTALMQGELTALPMLEGVVVLLSGALLLVPGFLTDAVGLIGLIPVVRQMVLRRFIMKGRVSHSGGTEPPSHPGRQSRTIEGEYRREDDS